MTKLELTSLRSMHLRGFFGFPFSAQPMKKRRELTAKWLSEGLIDKNCQLTEKGILATLPSVDPTKSN